MGDLVAEAVRAGVKLTWYVGSSLEKGHQGEEGNLAYLLQGRSRSEISRRMGRGPGGTPPEPQEGTRFP